MTKEELSKYYYLSLEIKQIEAKISEINDTSIEIHAECSEYNTERILRNFSALGVLFCKKVCYNKLTGY